MVELMGLTEGENMECDELTRFYQLAWRHKVDCRALLHACHQAGIEVLSAVSSLGPEQCRVVEALIRDSGMGPNGGFGPTPAPVPGPIGPTPDPLRAAKVGKETAIGIKQIGQGDYDTYDSKSLGQLVEQIQTDGENDWLNGTGEGGKSR